MLMLVLAYLLLGAAASSAVLVTRVERCHLPLAVFLAIQLAASLMRTAIGPLVVAAAGAPLTGWRELAGDVDTALWLLWPLGIASLACHVFGRGWPIRRMAKLWLWLALLFAGCYPWLRGERLRVAYLVIELLALSLAVVAALLWPWRRRAPCLVHVGVLCVIGIEMVIIFAGPWASDVWGRWDLAQDAECVLYGALTLLQGGALLLPDEAERA